MRKLLEVVFGDRVKGDREICEGILGLEEKIRIGVKAEIILAKMREHKQD